VCQGVAELGDDVVRPSLVGDEVQDRDDQEGHRPLQVQPEPWMLEDRLRPAQVGLDHRDVGRPAEQRVGVGEHHRVVVDVGDAGVDDLVHIALGGQAGAPSSRQGLRRHPKVIIHEHEIYWDWPHTRRERAPSKKRK
jgi:hypothetical protein